MSHVLTQFHYSVTGPEGGRKWVFLHGMMGYLQNWRRVTQALEGTERCLVYDQRGHGRSFHPSSGYAPEDYARDLQDILNELGWDKIILVGHSLGGRNAMSFAAHYPQYVEQLIVEDIGPEKRESAHVYYEKLLGSVPTPFSSREEAKKFFAQDFFQKVTTKENPRVLAQFLYANLQEAADGTVDWKFSKNGILTTVKEGRSKDHWHEIPLIQCPTLLIRGKLSSEFPKETYEKMLAFNPHFEGVEIDNAGHWVHSEKPEEFIAAIKRFTSL